MTSRAPVPAAEIGQPRRRRHSSGQRRLRELEPRQPTERPGPADSQRDRPKDAGPGRRRCRHGALPPARVRPTWSCRRPRPPQVRGRGKGAKPLPPTGPAAPRWGPPQAGGGRWLVFSAGAARAKFARLTGGGHRTAGPGLRRAAPAGPGLGAQAGPPRRGARVCPAGARAAGTKAQPTTLQGLLSGAGPLAASAQQASGGPSARARALGAGVGAGVRTRPPPALRGNLRVLAAARRARRARPGPHFAGLLALGLSGGDPGQKPARGGPWRWSCRAGRCPERAAGVPRWRSH